MKLISYRFDERKRYGIVKGETVIDVSSHFEDRYPTLRDVIAQEGLEEVSRWASSRDGTHSLYDIDYDIPIPNAQKIMCIGRNYRAYHEVLDTGKAPQYPSMFGRYINSFSAHGQNILKPKVADQLDYEGELVAIIGKRGRQILQEDALDYVAGYTIMNEGTLRDWMDKGTQNTPAKNFYHSGSIGPWMVTADEISDPSDLQITTRRNGEVVQNGSTNLMIFDLFYLIPHISKFTWLEPGDMIATGSPGGSIVQNESPQWLQEGDTIEVEISKVGTLRNGITNE